MNLLNRNLYGLSVCVCVFGIWLNDQTVFHSSHRERARSSLKWHVQMEIIATCYQNDLIPKNTKEKRCRLVLDKKIQYNG